MKLRPYDHHCHRVPIVGKALTSGANGDTFEVELQVGKPAKKRRRPPRKVR